MILRLQLLVIFTFSFFLLACTEDRNFDTDNKTVDIRLNNTEEITLEVVQSTFLTHLYLPVFEFLGETDLPVGSVKVDSINVPTLPEGSTLSCSDFPARSSEDIGTAEYCFDSLDGGVALYSFPAEQKYVAGERIVVKYENYVNELGWVSNGRLEATYLKTDGLNRDFVEADTVSCLVNLQSDLTDKTKVDETDLLAQLLDSQEGDLVGDWSINDVPLSWILPARDSNMLITEVRLSSKELNSVLTAYEFNITDPNDVRIINGAGFDGVKIIDVVGDGVRFIGVPDGIKVEVFGKIQVFNENGTPVLENGNPTFEIITDGFGTPILDSDGREVLVQKVLGYVILDENEKVIVINHSAETTDNQIASIDMDQVYSVSNSEVEEVSCQSFERELSASLTKLSVRKDNITYAVNGSLRLVEGTKDYIGFAREIRDSSFTTTVNQENNAEVYAMSGFSISYVQGSEFGSFAFDSTLEGQISSSAFPGVLEVFQGQTILGQDGSDRPTTGQFSIFGQGLERIFVTFKEFTVFLSVDYNGDSTGNRISDVDFRFEPNWDDLINRDFILPEEI